MINALGRAQGSVFNAAYTNGNIHINYVNKTSVVNGTFNLINTQGAVIAKTSLSKVNHSFDMPVKNVPAGMYFVKMNGVDVNGKSIVTQAPITIVK